MKRLRALWVLVFLLPLVAAATLWCAGSTPHAGTSVVTTGAVATSPSTKTPVTGGTAVSAPPGTTSATQPAGAPAPLAVFAAIGDHGMDDSHEAAAYKLKAGGGPA